MGPAFEITFADSDPGEPVAHRLDVTGLAVVRRAGQRHVLVAKAKALDRATLDERNGLDWLDGGSRQDEGVDVAPRRHHAAVGLDHGGDAFVSAFDDRAARDFDDHRAVAHGMRSNLITVTLSWCG